MNQLILTLCSLILIHRNSRKRIRPKTTFRIPIGKSPREKSTTTNFIRWAVIELNTADEYVCELAERLLDCAFGRDDSLTLEPLNVSVYLSVMLWAGFREPGKSDWVQHVLHETIGLIDDLENPALSVEQAFAAGWAAGRVAGEMESR